MTLFLPLLACTAAPQPTGDSPADSPADTDTRPLGDNLVARGTSPTEFLEATGTAWIGDDRVLLCPGANGLALYDVADLDQPARVATVDLPPPASFRCQHLGVGEGGRVVATHHGDETGSGWVALIDATDPQDPVGLASWSVPDIEPEGVAIVGTGAYVAAHDRGVLRFELTNGVLDPPASLAEGLGNAYVVLPAPAGLVVGTVDGEVVQLDLDGAELGRVPVAGPVRDLEWAADGALLALCGGAGIDRVDVEAGVVLAHAEVRGSALDGVVLDDGTLVVADWDDLRVFDGTTLELLGTEDPGSAGTAVALLGIDRHGDSVYAAEWTGLRTYTWDPTGVAPDIRVDAAILDLGTLASGEDGRTSLGITNEGPRDLTVRGVTTSDPDVAASLSATTLGPGESTSLVVSWISDGTQLAAQVELASDDPDEPTVTIPIAANRPTVGVGDLVPDFTYVAFNGTETWSSRSLGAPALLTYFATF